MKPYVKQEGYDLSNNDVFSAQRFRDEIFNVLRSFNIKMASDFYQTPKESENTALFTAGVHKAFLSKSEDFISAVPGTMVDAPVVIEVVMQISNIHFLSTVDLTLNAAVVFNNCSFDNVVSITTGGRAHFIGCTFRENAFVNNVGVAADVYVIGCVRTATAHINATIIAEVIA